MKLPLLLLLSLAATSGLGAEPSPLPAKIEFNRDVRPILSENCFKCHGFDPKAREADRRLDTREGALAERDGIRAIAPGKLVESDLHFRIHSAEKDEQMPPIKSGKKLTPREVAILDRWIEQGAEYQPHWAYLRPQRPALPPVGAVHPIDALVRARLAEIGLQPSSEADRVTLARRLAFDLTGLPPAPADLAAFVADRSPDAVEKLADRLLASPAYGERMALYWLDLVRYADSDGFHADNGRNVWPYRDYVIRAFNENQPFDRFTVEQLAGDLLPNATMWQKVASSFNRMNPTTEEGGAQAKDYEARSVADRVRAIGTTWLAQTTGCAQCHDHKYDPITARDFYQLGAFFADLKEPGIGKREDGMPVPMPEEEAKLAAFGTQVAALQAKLDAPSPALDAAQLEWERRTLAHLGQTGEWTPLHPVAVKGDGQSKFAVKEHEIIQASGPRAEPEVYRITVKSSAPAISGFRLEAFASEELPGKGPGRAQNGNFVLTEFAVFEASAPEQPLKLSEASATFEQSGFSAPATIDGRTGEKLNGWAVMGGTGGDQAIYFTLEKALVGVGEKTLIFTLRHDYGDGHALGKFRLSATGAPGPLRAPGSVVPAGIAAVLKLPSAQRTADQAAPLAKHFRSLAPELATVRAELAAAEKARADFEKTVGRCIVSDSMPTPRVVRILPRGNWLDETGPVVEPAVPAFLSQPAVNGRRLTRLDLANWVVAPENPLTARVFVNRLWKLFHGSGLSKVLDDFGAQGEPPANAALLDWLACEFVESGWNVKHLVRLMVTSQTYRQTSAASKELQQRDPYNREFARQSRFRLDAEMVRDSTLAISGLLVGKIGGPSVKPYQPAGYWENLNFPTREWQSDSGEKQWRRGLYTWWQRSYLHPSLLAFDAPSREECVAERVRSNIPQQALALLNDPTYVEASRVFAARIVREGGADDASRVAWAYGQALGRAPRADELKVSLDLLARHRSIFSTAPEAASQLVKVGIAPPAEAIDATQLAAWTSVARVLLNLHETITRS